MTTAVSPTLKQEILDLEKQYWDAMKTRDAATLKRLTADEFTMVMLEGVSTQSRDEFIQMMTSGDMTFTSYRLDHDAGIVRELSPDVVFAAYKAHSEYEQGGKPQTSDAYFSTTWVKRGGGWQAITGSESQIKPSS
jgi:uncharacterized protein (TIGR02246 family)